MVYKYIPYVRALSTYTEQIQGITRMSIERSRSYRPCHQYLLPTYLYRIPSHIICVR